MIKQLPKPIIERLVQYKRILNGLQVQGVHNIFSHDLASMAGNRPVQVRHDLMTIGYSSSARKGYDVKKLILTITRLLNHNKKNRMILVGVGNLGRAILSYFSKKQTYLELVAAFDIEEDRINRVIGGCHCYHMDNLENIVKANDVRIGMITLPAEAAQSVAGQMIGAGIRGIVNFAPIPLSVPEHIAVEQVDITLKLEKLAYFCR